MNIEQLRHAVAEKEANVKRLQQELEKEDRELVELEKQLEEAEELQPVPVVAFLPNARQCRSPRPPGPKPL